MLRGGEREIVVRRGAVDDQRVAEPELGEHSPAAPSSWLGELGAVPDDELAGLGLRRQRMLQRQRAHLLGQVVRVAAHDRAEGASAAAELRHARRAVTGAAGALLLVHLLAGAGDLGAASASVGAGVALGELPADHARDQVGARLEAEDLVGEFDASRRLRRRAT